MKRAAWLSLLFVFALLFPQPSSVEGAAPPSGAAFDVDTAFAPGSIVRFEHLTIEDGLSQNAGLAIFQDSRGFMWFGTQDGLNRYDGYTFKIYKHDPDNPNSLSHNSILAIAEDADGSLWFGTWGGGLNRYDPASETFTRFNHDPEDPNSLGDDLVTSILPDSRGDLWVGTLGGLDRFNSRTGGFDHFRNDPHDSDSLSNDAISVIFEDSLGQLWIGTGAFGVQGSGLNRFDPSTGKAVHYRHDDSDLASLMSNTISSIYEAPDGTLWIGTGGYGLSGGGLDHFDPSAGKAEHFVHDPDEPDSLASNDIMKLYGDDSGTLWIGTWQDGLDEMDLSNPGHFNHYAHDPFVPESLGGDAIWSLFRDHSGILWIGNINAGINKLSDTANRFSLYRHNPSNPNSLSMDMVGAFAQARDGTIWVGTWGGGLNRLNPATGRFQRFRHDPENDNSLSSDLVMGLYADSEGILWIGTMGMGLDRFDPRYREFTHYRHNPDDPASLADDNITPILRDKTGALWVGTFGGLERFDAQSQTFIHYAHDPNNPNSLAENKVVSLTLGLDNTLWIGTWGGGLASLDLNAPLDLDPKTATVKSYRHNPDDPSTLAQDSVWSILESSDGFLWLATEAGLDRFDLESETFRHYTEKSGLSNTTILGILQDVQGNLWLTTNNGLNKFDPATEKFTVYTKSDGLQSNEFDSNAYMRARDGELYVGGIHGFNVFNPGAIRPNPTPPEIAITGFQVYNAPVLADLSGQSSIQLTYKQDFISFEFAALDFHAPQKNQYAYKLEGFDDDWIQVGNRRYATYTNLPGGEYMFRLKASNSDGTWNETGVGVPIVITPPVWQTWWFNGLLIVVLSALVAGGFRWRLNTIREQNIRLETEIAERTSELRETNSLLEKEVEQRKRAEEALAKRAAEELRQSEARFQAVFENAAVGIAIMSLERRPLAFNPVTEKIIGYAFEELQNVDPRSLAIPEDRPIDEGSFKELVEGRRDSYVMERRYRRKDGRVFWARINYSLVRDLEGKPDYLIGIIEDIDDQKRAAERLAAQETEYRRNLEHRVEERTLALQHQIEQRQKAEKALADKAAQEAVTGERTRLARDLHDAVTQTLFSASLIAEVLPDIWDLNQAEGRKRLDELRQLTRGALAEMRTLLVELRPNALTEIPLPDLLRQLCESLIGRARLPIQLNVEGRCKLSPDVQIGLYRITQEALNNVVKHAKATQVVVMLRLNGDVRLSVADNGCGFNPTTVPPDHLGLKIMRERADAIGANLSIYSEPGEGTQISVAWKEKG